MSSGLKRRDTLHRVLSVQFKTSISDGMGVHRCIQYGQLARFGRHSECWKVYKGFRATYASPSRLCVFQQDNVKPHTTAITTAWLRSRRVRVMNWLACSPDLSPIENIWSVIKRKIRQRRPRTLQQLEAYIRQEWDQIPTTPETHNLNAQTSSNCFEKMMRCYTRVNMPCPNYFETCSRHQIWNELILCMKLKKKLSLNFCYVIYVLLWIKYYAHVIWNSFSSHFIKILK